MFKELMRLDGKILLWIQNNVRPLLPDGAIKGITYLGEAGWLAIAVCAVLLLIPKTRRIGIMCSCSLAATFLICNGVIKVLVGRTRPYETVEGLRRLVGKQPDTSFPSGHSSSSFSVAVVIFRNTRRRIGVPVLILAFLIALSRLYVGVHYPSDVIFGILFGSLFALITCRLWSRYFAKKDKLHDTAVREEK